MKIKNPFYFLVLFCFLLGTFTISAQGGGPNEQGFLPKAFKLEVQENQADSLVIWQERILMHIDKPIINEGSPLFFKTYLFTGPNRIRVSQSKVLKVELVNQSKDILTTQYHKIKNGMCNGTFLIPKKLENGVYTLRAYTRWMQNYGASFYATKKLVLGAVEKQSISTEIDKQEINISFHPEGGNLVSDFNNRLLIKATSKKGTPINLAGNIIDGLGRKIVSTVSYANGLMSVIFKPSAKEQYALETEDGSLYKLPSVLDKGYMLNVNNLSTTLLRVHIQASTSIRNKPIWIKGEIAGVTYLDKKLELIGSEAKLEISKKEIPFGTMNILLVDENEKILAKRPVLIDTDENLKLSILPLNTKNKENELAYKIHVTDENGKPISTEIAFSATSPIKQNQPIKIKENHDFLWKVADYAKNSEKVERFLKDLELLTSGGNEKLDYKSFPDKIRYPFQKGLDLFGYAYDLNNKLLKNTKIQMLSNSDASLIIRELKTDGSGLLRIENLQLIGENKLIFRTDGDDTKSRLVKLVPIEKIHDEYYYSKPVLDFKKRKNKESVQPSPWEQIQSEDLIELKEVEVSERKKERKRAMPAVYGLQATNSRTVVQDIDKPKFLFQLLSEIPGLRVFGSLEFPTIGTLRNSNSLDFNNTNSFGSTLSNKGPLWVIDGFIWGNEQGIVPEMGLNSWGIDRIEFLVGAEASIYGSRSAEGVFLIYTRNGSDVDYVNRKEGYINFQGYFDSPSFDSYSEIITKKPKKYKNKTTTLFWNPNIKTDKNGEAVVRFIPPIEYKNIEIKVSTVTKNGKVASVKSIF